MTNEVTELLDALQNGTMTVEEVAHRFRQRKWPRRRPADFRNFEEMARAELQDPDPYLPGSYDDVAAAYHQNKITHDQFRLLSEAVADAQSAEDEAT